MRSLKEEMMTEEPRGREFDLVIEQTVAPFDLEWVRGASQAEDNLGWNASYRRLPQFAWKTVKEVIRLERDTIDQICTSVDLETGYDRWIHAVDQGDASPLIGFDLGTNALTAALRAGRHLPYYSCNGGAFGDDHNDEHPVIGFLCRRPLLSFLLDAARESGVGLVSNQMQGITAYCRTVDAFIDMAEGLYDRRSEMAAISIREPKGQPGSAAEADDRQGTLF